MKDGLVAGLRPPRAASLLLGGLLAVVLMVTTYGIAADTVQGLRSDREAIIDAFRRHGRLDSARLAALERRISAFIANAQNRDRARALFERGTVQRMANRFEAAIESYREAADLAHSLGDGGTAFDAWLGIVRSHAYGTRNHGAAAAAFEEAVAVAGENPSDKQRYEIADYAAQLLSGRGELESALVNGLDAIRLARDDVDLFYAQLDTADVLQQFVQSCDHRKLVDAKTFDAGDDPWGACRRAVASTKGYYADAKGTAHRQGWRFLEDQAQGFLDRLSTRAALIDQQANTEKLGRSGVFEAQDVRDVLVSEDFSAGASALTDMFPIGVLIDSVAPEARATDPRSIYLRGLKADLDGDPQKALRYFQKAATLLLAERASLFDPRRRGTVVENRPELVRDLALRLLAFRQWDSAFTAFESLRSHGLGLLATAYRTLDLGDAERLWLSGVIQSDSEASAILNRVAERVIAGEKSERSAERLEKLHRILAKKRDLIRQAEFRPTIEKLSAVAADPPHLNEFEAAVRHAGIPVLFYWVTHSSVVVWVISPQGSEVKAVFLPDVAVIDKVGRLAQSVRTPTRPFDDTMARQLYTYLVKPFEKYLTRPQVLIVPQGPLTDLPFEVLMDAETGQFLAQRVAVSYAPSAIFAMQLLRQSPPDVDHLTAVFDQAIEAATHEIAGMGKVDGLAVTAERSQDMTAQELVALLGKSTNVHLLLHGEYDVEDPLQSKIMLNNRRRTGGSPEKMTAAQLLAVDWKQTRLAVFSSCEGAQVRTRISNEIFGFPWALLAGGVDQVVLSRWRVQSAENADWMAAFYAQLRASNRSPARAAAMAMRQMIDSGRRDPYFWAGPQVFGR